MVITSFVATDDQTFCRDEGTRGVTVLRILHPLTRFLAYIFFLIWPYNNIAVCLLLHSVFLDKRERSMDDLLAIKGFTMINEAKLSS